MGILAPSEVESRRFGMRVFRAETHDLDAKALLREILAAEADLVILRLPAGDLAQLSRLERSGLPYLVADTLVYYVAELAKMPSTALANRDLEFVAAGEGELESLDRLVGSVFAEYRNHYASNPFLPKSGLIDGYREWARSFASGAPEKRAWLIRRGSELVGFSTCSEHGDRGVVVVGGIEPTASGGGLYGDMIRFSRDHFRGRGLREMEVSTQVQNFAVQKVWSREGFVMREAKTTVHLNPFLHHSLRPLDAFEFAASAEEVEAWGELSGDRNPVHFSDEFASRHGFPSRIAHGLLPVSQLSRHFGTVYPGPGTLFLGFSVSFLKPLVVGGRYRGSIRYPAIDSERGFVHASADVRDGEGRFCLLAQCKLLRR